MHSSKLALVPLFFLGLNACTPVPPPVIHPNSGVKQRYEVVVDVGDLPVRNVSGSASFDIGNNQECVKNDNSLAIGGIQQAFFQSIDLQFMMRERGRFVATLIRDPFEDEDYYGRGVCHWAFNIANITLEDGIPKQTLSFGPRDLSNDSNRRESASYCAAELEYTYPWPANSCASNLLFVKKENINHLYKVTVYTKELNAF